MTPRAVLGIGMLTFCLRPICIAQPVPNVDQVLTRVQANVAEFESSLPDFICSERIASRKVVDGKVRRETVTDSDFVGLQRKSGPHLFTETRKIVTINGKPVAKGEDLTGFFLFGGGFSWMLVSTFAPKNIPYHNYRVAGTELLEGRSALLIEFTTKDDQTALRFDFNGKALIQRDAGKAWIDPESMQVLRLERRFLNVQPKSDEMITAVVDYTPVAIGEKFFWMPRRVWAEDTHKHAVTGQYLAEYSNYRKFDVSADIKY
jgi:hypothetical protein